MQIPTRASSFAIIARESAFIPPGPVQSIPVPDNRTETKPITQNSEMRLMATHYTVKHIACESCAKAKTKCDHKLPQCGRCHTRKIKCVKREGLRAEKAKAKHEQRVPPRTRLPQRGNTNHIKAHFRDLNSSHVTQHLQQPLGFVQSFGLQPADYPQTFPNDPQSFDEQYPRVDPPAPTVWSGPVKPEHEPLIGLRDVKQEDKCHLESYGMNLEAGHFLPQSQDDMPSCVFYPGLESSPVTGSEGFSTHFNYGSQLLISETQVCNDSQGVQYMVYDDPQMLQDGTYQSYNLTPHGFPMDYTGNNSINFGSDSYPSFTGLYPGTELGYSEWNGIVNEHPINMDTPPPPYSTPLSTTSFSTACSDIRTPCSLTHWPDTVIKSELQDWHYDPTAVIPESKAWVPKEQGPDSDAVVLRQPNMLLSRFVGALSSCHSMQARIRARESRLPLALHMDENKLGHLSNGLQRFMHILNVTKNGRMPTEHPLILPPASVLAHFFDSYWTNFELYYPILPAHDVITSSTEETADGVILLLLCLAAGALTAAPDTGIDTTGLANGLVACGRTALFEARHSNTIRLRAIFLFLSLAAWGGDAQHVEYARCQHKIYLNSLRSGRSGHLAAKSFDYVAEISSDLVDAHRRWTEYESNNRLVYSWLALDQEYIMFFESELAPKDGKSIGVPIHEIQAPLPLSDELWNAASAEEWSDLASRMPSTSPSLKTLYDQFLNTSLRTEGLTPLHLRLLLYPLHQHANALVSTLNASTTKPNQLTKNGKELEEVRRRLSRWYDHAQNLLQSLGQQDLCDSIHASEILYHLITINTVIRFNVVERLAHKELRFSRFLETFCIFPERAMTLYYHCGQVLRIFREIQPHNRPLWLGEAVHRVALVLWASSMYISHTPGLVVKNEVLTDRHQVLYIDRLRPDVERGVAYEKFWRHGEGLQQETPMLLSDDGKSSIRLEPMAILEYCADLASCDHFAPSQRVSQDLKALAAQPIND